MARLSDMFPERSNLSAAEVDELRAEISRLREALKLADVELTIYTSAANAGNGPSPRAYDALVRIRAALEPHQPSAGPGDNNG